MDHVRTDAFFDENKKFHEENNEIYINIYEN